MKTSPCHIPIFTFKRLILNVILISCALITEAQNTPVKTTSDIKGTTTDKKYSNTTIIYRKENSNDQNILNEVSNDFGIGDVVRITDAPPPPPPTEKLSNNIAVKVDAPTIKPSINTPSVNQTAPITAEPIYASSDAKPIINTKSTTEKQLPTTVVSTPMIDVQYGNSEAQKGSSKVQKSVNVEQKAILSTKKTQKSISSTSSNSRNHYRTNSRLLKTSKKKGFLSFLFGSKKSKNSSTKKGDKKYGCYKF